jgi:hypothetical protein
MTSRDTLSGPVGPPIHVSRISIFLLALLFSAVAHAQDSLTGTVVSRDGKPKPNVPVDILGPTKVYTETDSSGAFTVRLRQGSYVIRVRDGDRRAEFSQQIAPGSNKARFQLRW